MPANCYNLIVELNNYPTDLYEREKQNNMNSNAYLNLAASLSDYEATNTERPNSNLNVDDALSVLHSQKWQIEAECVDSIINYVRTAHQRDITAKFSISELVTVATSHA